MYLRIIKEILEIRYPNKNNTRVSNNIPGNIVNSLLSISLYTFNFITIV